MKKIFFILIALLLLQGTASAQIHEKLAPELIELIEAAETGNQPEKVAELFEFHYSGRGAGVNVQLLGVESIEQPGFEILEDENGWVKGFAGIDALKALAERKDVNFIAPGEKEFFDEEAEFKIPEIKIEPQNIEFEPWHFAVIFAVFFALAFAFVRWKKKRDYYHF